MGCVALCAKKTAIRGSETKVTVTSKLHFRAGLRNSKFPFPPKDLKIHSGPPAGPLELSARATPEKG